jgi:UDP-N-acetylglucosamine acyltransferase
MIHETALIGSNVKLGNNVSVGAYTIIEGHVEIGDDTNIGAHVVIKGHTKIGKNNKFLQFGSIGEDPQDLKYKGEETYLDVGDNNLFREFCTINRGTVSGGGVTKIGNNNMFMAYVHVAHDCLVGNHIICANNATLSGHVEIEDYASLGGLSAVHQFCRIGSYAFVGGGSMVDKSVPPFIRISGYYAKPYGLNTVGLMRRGFSKERIADIKAMYRIVYRKNLTLKEAIETLKKEYANAEDLNMYLRVLENTERGIVR